MPLPVAAAASVVSAGANLAQTITNIADAKKRREVEFAMNKLSKDQQLALDRDLGRAKTQAERLMILSNAMAMIRSAETTVKLQNLGKEQEAQRKKEMLTYILIASGGLGIFLIAFLIKKT